MSRSEFEPTNFGRFRMAIRHSSAVSVIMCGCQDIGIQITHLGCAGCKSHYRNRNAIKQINTKPELKDSDV